LEIVTWNNANFRFEHIGFVLPERCSTGYANWLGETRAVDDYLKVTEWMTLWGKNRGKVP
jgi:hypothetical protein